MYTYNILLSLSSLVCYPRKHNYGTNTESDSLSLPAQHAYNAVMGHEGVFTSHFSEHTEIFSFIFSRILYHYYDYHHKLDVLFGRILRYVYCKHGE